MARAAEDKPAGTTSGKKRGGKSARLAVLVATRKGAWILHGDATIETDTISRFLSATIEARQPCVLRFRLETDRSQVIGTELAGFPLTAADGRSTHIFGGLFPFREIASLDYGSLIRFELAAARSIWTENLVLTTPAERPAALALRNFRVIAGGRVNN